MVQSDLSNQEVFSDGVKFNRDLEGSRRAVFQEEGAVVSTMTKK